MFDIARSLAVADGIPPEPRACYKNALLAFLARDELHDGCYVEGFAVPDFGNFRLPLEHGWVELPDGTVIDPSLAVLGHTDVAFFPAIRLTYRQAERLVADEVALPCMLSHRSEPHRRNYLKAQAQAHEAAFGAAVAGLWHEVA